MLSGAQLWECHDAALAVSKGIVRNEADCRDVAQEVLIKVWQKYNSFEGSDEDLLRIARRMATNASIDVLRRTAKQEAQQLELDLTDGGDELLSEQSAMGALLESPDDLLAVAQQKDAIMQAINELPMAQAVAYFMHANDRSFEEIAAHLDTSLVNARQLVSRAVSKLRWVADNY